MRCRALAANCEFRESLDLMLVDKFITGLTGEMFERLCEKRAVEIALTYECKQQRQQNGKEDSINYVKKTH